MQPWGSALGPISDAGCSTPTRFADRSRSLALLPIALDLVDVGLAEALPEVGVGWRECRLELRLVDVLRDDHALRAQIRQSLAFVVVDARAIGLDTFPRGVEKCLLVGVGERVPARLVHENDRRRIEVAGEREVLLHLVEL